MDDTRFDTAFSSIELLLDVNVARDDGYDAIRKGLQAGRLVIVRDAFRSAFAERMHHCLDHADGWPLTEGGEGAFRFHHHNLYQPEHFPSDLAWCRSVFDSADTKELVGRLSGRDCSGTVSFSASWYMPGDYSLPHSDHTGSSTSHERQVAFIWHLTRTWDPSWGGHLYWGPAQRSITPSFNTLFLFTIDPGNAHFVSQVAPFAQSKRLAINGWWMGPPSAQPEREQPRSRKAEQIEVL